MHTWKCHVHLFKYPSGISQSQAKAGPGGHNAKNCIFSKSPNSFTSTTLPACIPSPAASSRALKQRRPRPVRESPPVPLFRAGWLSAGSWNKTGHIRKLPMGSCSSQVAADATSSKQADIPTQRKSSAKVSLRFYPKLTNLAPGPN